MVLNYQEIAQGDIAVPIQNQGRLDDIAGNDLAAMGDVTGLRVLEIGPGQGHLARRLIRHNADVHVADLVGTYVDRLPLDANKKRIFDIQDGRQLPKEWTNRFDLIVLTDVLEHLTHPVDALLSCKKLLNRGGKLYIRVPTHESLVGYSQALGCPFPLVHLRTFDKTTLRREVLAAGFVCSRGPRYSRNAERQPGRLLTRSASYWAFVRRQLRSQYLSLSEQTAHVALKASSEATDRTFLQAIRNLSRKLALRLATRPGEAWVLCEVAVSD